MKTPDEIKKGLEYCYSAKPCVDCSYDKRDFPHCVRRLLGDAINEYNALESRLAQVERERDAMLLDLKEVGCGVCKHSPHEDDIYIHNVCLDCVKCCNFERRGVCEENTKEEAK